METLYVAERFDGKWCIIKSADAVLPISATEAIVPSKENSALLLNKPLRLYSNGIFELSPVVYRGKVIGKAVNDGTGVLKVKQPNSKELKKIPRGARGIWVPTSDIKEWENYKEPTVMLTLEKGGERFPVFRSAVWRFPKSEDDYYVILIGDFFCKAWKQ